MAVYVDVKALIQNYPDYEEAYAQIQKQVEEGTLQPVKSSGSNHRNPPLYNRYRNVTKKETYEQEKRELEYEIMPPLSTEFYKSHLKTYQQDRQAVLQLNSFLMRDPLMESFCEPVSVNERSFQIWHQEKFLQSKGRKILERLQFPFEELNCYETVEPVSSYSLSDNPDQNILILENLDPYVTLRRIMMESRPAKSIDVLGRQVSTIVYGGGKRIWSFFKDWIEFGDPALLSDQTTYLYFGDLDYVGIDIFEKLRQKFPDWPVDLFVEGYLAMLEKAKDCPDLPETKEGQKETDAPVFWRYFSSAHQKAMQQILENRQYLCQEMLNRKDYLPSSASQNSVGKEDCRKMNGSSQ